MTWIRLPGCCHDWVILEAETAADVRYRVRCDESGEDVPRFLFPDDGHYLLRRVCIKCEMIDDQIAATEHAARLEYKETLDRKAKAQAIYDAANGETTCPK